LSVPHTVDVGVGVIAGVTVDVGTGVNVGVIGVSIEL
jgi:hypothetical protein